MTGKRPGKAGGCPLQKLITYLPDWLLLAAVWRIWLYPMWKPLPRTRLVLNTIFYLYLCCVAAVTLMPVLTSLPQVFHHSYRPMNMSPLIDITEGHLNARQEFLLNVLMMMPFGFLLPLVHGTSLKRTVLAAFLISLCIELLQPLLSTFRAADITDLLSNTLGGTIGCLIFLAAEPLLKRHLPQLFHS